MQLLAIALAPILAIILYIYGQDTFEKEPKKLLLKAFGLGALSIIPAVIFEGFAGAIGLGNEGALAGVFVHAFFGVAIIEELSKYFMVKKYLYPNKNFDEPFDGIIYAVMVSLGFAALENIMYTFEHGFGTGVMRAFTAVPAHAAFGIMMGYFMGKARFGAEKKNLIYAVLVSTLFHGAYDFSLMQNEWKDFAFLGAILSLIVCIWFGKKAIEIHQNNSPFK